ncbi:MAG: lipid-A-disaccharide synthase [Planctomycetota bacterium]|jgi:lipid-A-disaccharide synthase
MGARLQTTRELGRAVLDLGLAPLRILAYACRRGRLAKAVEEDLNHPAEVQAPRAPEGEELNRLRERGLSICISCAEPSGEIHARSLVKSLRQELKGLGAPEAKFFGLGGTRLRDDGVEIIGDPVSRAAMGADVLRVLPFYLGLITDMARALEERRPDVLLLVDSPALHVPLGRIARRLGIPVLHFVTPQYWAWAPWRVGGYRSAVDLALTILPFEPPWFARHNVPTAHVGHPLLDVLESVKQSEPGAATPDTRSPRIALLPGSRESVVRRNLPWMLDLLKELRADMGELRVVLPHDRDELRPLLTEIIAEAGAESWTDVTEAGLHSALADVDAAFSVSGTILLDLLHHRLPTVVIYRLKSKWMAALQDRALTVPYFSSTNLLAGRELLREFAFIGDGPRKEVLVELRAILTDIDRRTDDLAGLGEVAARLGPPGAARRAAGHALLMALSAAPKTGPSRPE